MRWLILAALLALTGCGPEAPPTLQPAPPQVQPAPGQPAAGQPAAPKPSVTVPIPIVSGPRTIKVGALPTIGLAPMLIAQAKGYFSQEGLTVEIVNFTSTAEMVPALASGQIDAAVSMAPSADLVNAVAQGAEVRIVGSNGTLKPHRNIANIIVRKDLAPASGVLDFRTLKPPLRAAATEAGTLAQAVVVLEAEKAGFQASDVTMSYLALPDMNAALQNKQVDLAVSSEPFISLAEQQGVAVRWHAMADDFADLPYSTLVYGSSLLSKDQEGGVRLMRAYLQGTRDYEDALSRNRDRDTVVGILADPLKMPAALLQSIQDSGGLAYIDPNGGVHIDTLKPVLDLWVRTGLVQAGFDLTRLVDGTPASSAVQNMGVAQ